MITLIGLLHILITVNENGHQVHGQDYVNEKLRPPYDIPEAYYCVYIKELLNTPPDKWSITDKKIDLMNCSQRYDCWQSQLMDINRQSLIKTFNDYKSDVAAGKCPQCKHGHETIQHSNVFKMTYHWYLELISLHLTKKIPCPFSYHERMGPIKELEVILENYTYPGNINIKDYEHGTYIFAITSYILTKHEGRDEAVEKFRTFLNTKATSDIIFNSWPNETTGSYYLGSVDVFGCSIIIRDGVFGITGLGETAVSDRVAFLSCAFASRIENTFSILGSNSAQLCRLYSDYVNIFYDTATKLCHYKELAHLKQFEVPCQLYYDYFDADYINALQEFTKPCPGSVPHKWLGVVAPLPNIKCIQARIGQTDFVIPVHQRLLTTASMKTI